LVSKLNLEGKILFKEPLPINKIADAMANADIGVVPKRADSFGNEAFSTKTLEFMVLNVPVIISRTKIDEFYFDESMVTFFESDNENDLAENMLTLIHDKDLRERKAANAIKYVSDNTWNIKQSIYLDLVDSLFE
jgi:glycosyltransferase involved in cell wall biosynthesis